MVALLAAVWIAACGGSAATWTWTTAHPNGMMRVRAEKQGTVLHGRYEEFHPSGRRSVAGGYRHGLPHGEFTRWDEDGAVIRRTVYERGQIVWTTTDAAAPAPRPILRDDPAPIGDARPFAVTQVHWQLGLAARGGVAAHPAGEPGDDLDGHRAATLAAMVRHRAFYIGAEGSHVPSNNPFSETYVGLVLGAAPQIGGPRWLAPELGVAAGGHWFSSVRGPLFRGQRIYRDGRKIYAGVHANLVATLSRYLAVVAGVHLRRDLGGQDWELQYITCVESDICMVNTEDWKIGGTEVGAGLYLRYTAR